MEVFVDSGCGVDAEPGFVGGFQFVFGACKFSACFLAHGIDGGGHECPERRGSEGVDVVELTGEEFGGGGADVADAHPCEDACEPLGLGGFDACEKVVHFLVGHAVELDESIAMVFEIENVGEVVERDVRGADEVDGGFAKPFDVHLLAACEPDELLADLGGTFWVHAAADGFEVRVVVGFGRFDFQWCIACRAVIGREDRVGVHWAAVGDDADDLGDDFAGFFDFDGITCVEIAGADHAVVVECGVGDGCAGEIDGLEGGAGGDFAGLADLVFDAQEACGLAFGGELVGDAPTGGFAGVAELLLLGKGIDADDDAVGCVVEGVAEVVDPLDGFVDVFARLFCRTMLAHIEAEVVDVV